MINKITFFLIFLFSITNILYPEVNVVFDYRNIRYNLLPIEKSDYKIAAFNSLKEADQFLKHKMILTSIERSKLVSLLYVGDRYEFNNIEIILIDYNIYQIKDKLTDIKITFSIGEYDSIILHSTLNFGEKEITVIDKLASSLAVKLLLKRITGTIQKEDKPVVTNEVTNVRLIEEYNEFLNQLNKLNKQEIFDYLKNYIDINFQVTGKKSITEDWIHPARLYFYKEGDYKSLALFYYYTLKSLGFKVRSYFVTDLVRKQKEDLDDMYALFSKKYKNNKDLEKIRVLETEYKQVNSSSNLTSFINNYKTSKYGQPSAIYFYYPPIFESSIFIVTVEINNKWIYTTGENWVDASIYTPERVCVHYARSGCYYSYIMNDLSLVNNEPIFEESIEWDIFFRSN